MSLNETGRTGVKVNLTADGVFGIVTQDPESMLHSPGGIDNADGNTGFGQRFTLTARIAQTATGTTTATLANANSPFKFRVIEGEIECLQDGRRWTEKGSGRSAVNVLAGSTSTVASVNVTGMREGDIRPVKVNTLGNEIVDEDGSLSVVAVSVLPVGVSSATWELLVKLHCMRVI